MRAPLFIVLEGIDGSGTTTQMERLVVHLRARGRAAIGTREPSTGPIGVLLRQILLGGHRIDGAPVSGDPMALLFAADRRDHLQREIEPALARGQDVVCDRYQWSSLAYQAAETDRTWVSGLSRNLRQPDVTILVEVTVAAAAQRRRAAGRVEERYDDDGYQTAVAAAYHALAQHAPDRSAVVDGSRSIDEVAVAIATVAERLMMPTPASPPAAHPHKVNH